MVSAWSGVRQVAHALRMWICQRRKSVGVGFMVFGLVGQRYTQVLHLRQYPLEIFHASDDYIFVANCLHDPLPPLLRERLPASLILKLQEYRTSIGQVYHVADPSNHAHCLHHAACIGIRCVVVYGKQSATLVGKVIPMPLEAIGLNLELAHDCRILNRSLLWYAHPGFHPIKAINSKASALVLQWL